MIWVYTRFFYITLHSKTEYMEEIKKTRGGKREGAGRKAVGISTHAMALKLDNDLFEALSAAKINKNRFINDAVREKMVREGYNIS